MAHRITEESGEELEGRDSARAGSLAQSVPASGDGSLIGVGEEPWRRRLVPPFLRREKLAGQMVRFGIVGAINTLVDWGLFFLFNVAFNAFSDSALVTHPGLYLTANGIAYTAGIVNSFLWNKHWTFSAGGTQHWRREAAVFVLVSLASLGINTAGLFALRAVFTGTSLLTVALHKLGTTGVTMTWNFFGYRFLAFSHAVRGHHHDGRREVGE